MRKQPTADFAEFIEFFPELELPLSLLPDVSQIPLDPLPLPGVLQDEYILPFEADELDEYTEFVPFGRIAGTKDFYVMVYWKAGLMRYEYILATYSKNGDPLSHAIVSGIRYEDEGALHSVAVIHEDLRIVIAEGRRSHVKAVSLCTHRIYSVVGRQANARLSPQTTKFECSTQAASSMHLHISSGVSELS